MAGKIPKSAKSNPSYISGEEPFANLEKGNLDTGEQKNKEEKPSKIKMIKMCLTAKVLPNV